MIPKIIHYIWFGGNPYSEKIRACMRSWKKYLPEYEFMLWNEETFDLSSSCDFVRQAYENKKWAFVSDYVRVWALNKFGGVYLDTDVEICQPLDSFLDKRMILGTDETGHLTAFMASEKGHPLWIDIMNLYENMQFVLPDGTFNTKVNNAYIENKLQSLGYKIENSRQSIEQGIEIYPDEYFHAADHMTGEFHITEHTYGIHWHTLTWCDRSTHLNRFLRVKILGNLIGGTRANKLFTTLSRLVK